MDAVIVKDLQHPFVCYSYRPCLATVEQNRPCPLYVPRPKTGLRAREFGTSKINPSSDLLGALAVYDEHRAELLEFVNTLPLLTIKQYGLVLLTRNEVFEALPTATAWR